MRSSAVGLTLALLGCGPAAPVVLPPEGAALVFARLDGAGAPSELFAYAADELPDPLQLDGASRWWALGYDAPMLEELVRDDERRVELRGAEAPIDEAWPLRPPARALELDGERTAPIDAAALGAWLARFRVARPPCAPPYRVRNVSGLEGRVVHGVAPLGDDLLLEGARNGERPPDLFLLRAGASEAEPLHTETTTGGFAPHTFLDGERLFALRTAVDRSIERVELDRRGAVLSRERVLFDVGEPGFVLTEVVARRFPEGLTLIARAREYPAGGYRSRVFGFDAATGRFRTLLTGSSEGSHICDSAFDTLLLEIEGPGRGVAGLLASPILRFDLAGPSGGGRLPFLGETLCRSAYATLEDGVELFAYLSLESGGLAWRSPGGAWTPLVTGVEASGRFAFAHGDRALVAGAQGIVAMFEHTAARPEIPPRYCGDLSFGSSPFVGAARPDGSIFLGGNGNVTAVILEP